MPKYKPRFPIGSRGGVRPFVPRLLLSPVRRTKAGRPLETSHRPQCSEQTRCRPPFSDGTPRVLRQSVRRGEFAVSLDLTDAYLHVPMHRSAQRFLRFAIDNKVYAFRAMPFGLISAPGLLQD